MALELKDLKLTATTLANGGETVNIEINEDVVEEAAYGLAMVVSMANDTVADVLDFQEIKECFRYALKVVLVQNCAGKRSFEIVPIFFQDITMPFATNSHSVRITTNQLSLDKRPNSYAKFLMLLSSLGVPTDKVLPVSPTDCSGVLEYDVKDVLGEPQLVGASKDPRIDELIVRSFINVVQESKDKLERITGHLEFLYVSRDELIRQWTGSFPVAKR